MGEVIQDAQYGTRDQGSMTTDGRWTAARGRSSSLVLRVARAGAWAFTLSAIVLFLYAATQYYAYAVQLPPEVRPNAGWSAGSLRSALEQLGLTPPMYVLYNMVAAFVLAFWSAVVAILILWRRGDNAFSLFLAVELVAIGVLTNPVASYIQILFPSSQPVERVLSWFLWPGFFVLFYLFPDGRFVPRWARWLAVIWGIFALAGCLATLFAPDLIDWLPFPLLPLMITAFGSQVYRYLRVSDALERQQTKVVLAAVCVLLVLFPLVVVVNRLYGINDTGLNALRWMLVNTLVVSGVMALFPIAIGVAILRYRLWDVDIIIRKTLVYAVLTALLALVYFGSIAILQGVVTATSGQSSTIVIVLSTLAIAALFNPLRRRIQAAIDHRFYRKKYDAAQVLAAFAATARDEPDLERLSAELMTTVSTTMRPSHLGLWLQPQATRRAFNDETGD